CSARFLPGDYLRLDEYSHAVKSWSMYEHVAHRTSLNNIATKFQDYFGLSMFAPVVHAFKVMLSQYYEETYKRLLEKIVAGSIMHADETEVHLRGVGKGYVWVFT